MARFVIVPAYNEERNIGKILIETSKLRVKPVIVDDGSSDKTFRICAKRGVIALRHETNKGKGEAVKTGLNYILKKYPNFSNIVLMDADMQYHPTESIKIFDALEKDNLDFVIGQRDWKEVPFRHRIGNFVWRNAFNIMFKTDFKDTNCGMMGFNRKAAEKLKDHILGGYIVDNSILIGAIKNNLKIGKAPVNVSYHKKSKVVRGIRVVLGVLLYIMREGLRYRLGRKK